LTKEVATGTLTLVVTTPAKDTTIIGNSNGMMFTTSHHDYRYPIKVLHFFWKADVLFVPNTELSMIVESPRINLLRFVDIKRVMISGPNILSVTSSDSLNHECLSILVASIKHTAKFSTFRVTPSINLAISCQC
jgi:hypothetical protein